MSKNLKIITIIFFLLSFATLEATSSEVIQLTSEERDWLNAHPNIQLGTTTSYPPMVIKRDDGAHTGLLLDLFKLINQRLQSNIKIDIDNSWANAQKKAKLGVTDGLAIGGKIKARDAIFNASNLVFPTYFYVFARSHNEFTLTSLKDLVGLKVGYKKAAIPTKRILDKYPDINSIPYDDNLSLSKALLSKEVDVVVAWISYDYWRREALQGTIENVLLLTEYPMDFVIYTRKDWPELTGILNKAIESVRQNGLAQLMDKWFVGRLKTKNNNKKINLTSKERNWLKDHPKIKYGFDPSWAPVEYAGEKGAPHGMSPAYMKRISEILDIEITPIHGLSWNKAIEMIGKAQLDVLPATSKTKKRLQTMRFTDPYLSLPIAIFSSADMTYVRDIKELYGKNIAVAKGYAIHEWLKRDHSQLNIIPVKNNEEGLKLASEGKVIAFIGNLVTTSYYIGKTSQFNIRVVGQTTYSNELSVAVRKDWPELVTIIQKALNSIPENEKEAIYHDWISIRYQHEFDYALLWKVLSALAVVIFFILLWNRRLSHEVERRKLVEVELFKAKNIAESASEAKSIFLSSISHDVRTPLGSILGYSELIDMKSQSEETKKYTGQIIIAGNHILDLVNQLLELSKIESGAVVLSIDSYKLNDLIDECLSAIMPNASKRGITIKNLLPQSLETTVMVDKIRFKQVVFNLLSNAIKYNNQDGKIIINSDVIDNKFIKLLVTDTGNGLTDEQQAHLFKAYDRAGAEGSKIEGTGLGLVISKDLIEKMDGSIGLESEVGKGTSFWVQVPISK